MTETTKIPRRCGWCDRKKGKIEYFCDLPVAFCTVDDLHHSIYYECPYDLPKLKRGDDDKMAEKKPRLCEILGVEVGEKFKVKGYDGYLSLDPDGTFNVLDGNGYGASRCLLMAIENPENVIHRPPLTEPELAICKAVGAKWISMDTGSKQLKTTAIDLWSAEPDEDEGYYTPNKPNDFLAYINANLFPSMKPGDCFMIK